MIVATTMESDVPDSEEDIAGAHIACEALALTYARSIVVPLGRSSVLRIDPHSE